MAKSASERYLKRRGNQYQFRRDIPAALRSAFDGKTAIIEPLRTADTRIAKARRDELARETDRLFREARDGVKIEAARALHEAAEVWLKEIEAHRTDPLGWSARAGVVVEREEDALDPSGSIDAEASRIEREQGEAARDRFLDKLHGRVGVDEYVDPYLGELDLKPKTKSSRGADIRAFAEWASDRRLTIRQVNRRRAAEYFEERLIPINRKTAETKLSNLKVYWRWLIERGHYDEASPWEGLRLPTKRKTRGEQREEDERPFTDEEIRKLFGGLTQAKSRDVERMADAMVIGALSGMRLGEICKLTLADCEGGNFVVREGKSEAAARSIPIHSGLAEIVKRRSAGKAKTDKLFSDVAGKGPSPSDPLSKQFGRYIRDIGVADLREGHRRSKTNFHSFRRRFVEQALRGGTEPHIVSWVVGHAEGREGITLGVYDRNGPSVEQMRACVEAVKLKPA